MNPGPGSNYSLEIKMVISQGTKFVFTYQVDLKELLLNCFVCV